MNLLVVRHYIKIGLITLIGFNFMLLIVPILLPILLATWLFSQLVFAAMRVKFGSAVSKASGMDIVNGKENHLSRPYINIAFRSASNRNPPDIQGIRSRFQEVVLDRTDDHSGGRPVFDKFTKVFEKIWGYYVWRDCEEFDLRNHIRLVDTRDLISRHVRPHGPDAGRTDLAGIKWEVILNYLLADVGAKPVRDNLPKWEILILPETADRYTTLFRVHHSITDGLYFVRLIVECIADKPVQVRLPFKPKSRNALLRVLQDVWSFALLPYGLFKALTTNDRNPLHGPKLTGTKNFLLADPFSLSLLRDIKRVAKVTVNDLIFSCVSYAAAQHFHRREASVEKITVLLAVNLQEEKKPLRLKNDFAVTCLQLPTSSVGFLKNSSQNKQCTILIDKDSLYDLTKMPALSRLQIVKNSLDEAKNDPCLMSVCWLLTSFSFLLPACIAEALISTQGITMDISNIQGPQNHDLVMHGAPAEDVAFWLPDRDPLGIGVSILSYDGFIRTGLIVDRALMDDEQQGYQFLSDFRQEVLNLHEEITMLSKSAQEKGDTELCSFLPKPIP